MILGGAQENTLLSVEGLNRRPEFVCDLVSGVDAGPEGELLTRARQSARVIVVPEMGRRIHPTADMIALVKLYWIIRDGQYHIVHTHSSKAGVLGRLAARLAGTPIVVHTLHSLVFHDRQPWIVNRGARLVKRLCVPLTDHYISVSSIVAERAVAAGIGTRESMTTIYSGMELDWFLDAKVDAAAVRSELGIALDAPVIGKIARLFPLKGHDELLDAASAIVRAVPNVRFLLVGDGVLRQHVEDRARQAGILENFVFAGLVPRERIPEMIAAMDVVVHTSLREGLARVLPQALAMGKPCISVELDGAPEVVRSGETGYLVPAGDHDALAARATDLLRDPELRTRLGRNGRRLVDPMFRAETMVDGISAVYGAMLERHAARLNVSKSLRADRRID